MLHHLSTGSVVHNTLTAPSWNTLNQPRAVFYAALIALIVGIVGFYGLHLNRRQTEKHWRITSRRERFTTIATQLADPNPAVRIAGVYAMEALINDWLGKNTWYSWKWSPSRRSGRQEAQACINVLCTYLRLPYTPPPDGVVTVTKQIITEHRTTPELAPAEPNRRALLNVLRPRPVAQIETHHEYRHDDRQVRNSIVEAIVRNTRPARRSNPLHRPFHRISLAHRQIALAQEPKGTTVRRPPPLVQGRLERIYCRFILPLINHPYQRLIRTSPAIYMRVVPKTRMETDWSYLDYDFSGTLFHHSDFTRCNFFGRTSFSDCVFHEDVSFSSTTFSEPVEFNATRFDSDVRFSFVRFLSNVSFEGVTFKRSASFHNVNFTGQAQFAGLRAFWMLEILRSNFLSTCSFIGMEVGPTSTVLELGERTPWLAIKSVEFRDQTLFNSLRLHKPGEFKDVVFMRNAAFNNAQVAEGLRFINSTFQGKFGFEAVKLTGGMMLRAVKFYQDVSFKESQIKGDIIFTGKVRWPSSEFAVECSRANQALVDKLAGIHR